MKKCGWLALVPFLLAGTAACDDFGFAPEEKENGTLTWTLDGNCLTKAGIAEIPDTNDFILTIQSSGGATLYEGSYGDSPESLSVQAGNYTVSIRSIAFTSPAFSRPQYGDDRTVVVKSGESVHVKLECSLLNAGMRLKISPDFLTAYPGGVLFLKQNDVRLKYFYNEKRIAYFLPGNVNVILNDNGKDETLITKSLEAREILTLGIGVSSRADGKGISVEVDTSKVWISESYVIGGSVGNDGSAPSGAISVGEAKNHAGENGVWVYGYIVGGDLTSAGNTVKTSGITKNTHLALADRSSVTTKSSCLAVELPKGDIRDALNLVDHPDFIGRRVYLKGNIVSSYFGTAGLKGTTGYEF